MQFPMFPLSLDRRIDDPTRGSHTRGRLRRLGSEEVEVFAYIKEERKEKRGHGHAYQDLTVPFLITTSQFAVNVVVVKFHVHLPMHISQFAVGEVW